MAGKVNELTKHLFLKFQKVFFVWYCLTCVAQVISAAGDKTGGRLCAVTSSTGATCQFYYAHGKSGESEQDAPGYELTASGACPVGTHSRGRFKYNGMSSKSWEDSAEGFAACRQYLTNPVNDEEPTGICYSPTAKKCHSGVKLNSDKLCPTGYKSKVYDDIKVCESENEITSQPCTPDTTGGRLCAIATDAAPTGICQLFYAPGKSCQTDISAYEISSSGECPTGVHMQGRFRFTGMSSQSWSSDEAGRAECDKYIKGQMPTTRQGWCYSQNDKECFEETLLMQRGVYVCPENTARKYDVSPSDSHDSCMRDHKRADPIDVDLDPQKLTHGALEKMNPLRNAKTEDGAFGDPTNRTPGNVVTRLLKNILFPLGGLLLFLMIVLGGFQIVSGSTMGNNSTVESGKRRIMAATVGFLLLFASYWMWTLVEYALSFGTTS